MSVSQATSPAGGESPVSLVVSRRAPVHLCPLGDGAWFIDFGQAVFGSVEIQLREPPRPGGLRFHLGERRVGLTRVDRAPPGCVRYRCATELTKGESGWHRLTIPPDTRNTGPRAIRMPAEIGEVLPFRYCEIENLSGLLTAADIRQTFVHVPFNDAAATFECSEPVLNDVWELCKHTIKATSFCGLYVDGDRERIPYEGDTYINQLSHYCVDAEYGMARRTHEHLLRRATWPTEWLLHSVFMAWYDYLYSGHADSLQANFDLLKAKSLIALAGPDGLISTRTGLVTEKFKREVGLDPAFIDFESNQNLRDLVDWPHAGFQGREETPGETDGYVFTDFNTAVNALHLRALELMRRISRVVGRADEERFFAVRADQVARSLNERCFDPARGIYVDGIGTTHASLHANFLPLLAGGVPAARIPRVLEFVHGRGMACSVYGAQHLLDALYKAGAEREALALLTATHERSWAHMIHGVGSTMTLEAWDERFKRNLDWNHAWGAAPANIIVRRLLGVRPAAPGFARCLIDPQRGGLSWARGRVPTPRGPIEIELWDDAARGRQVRWKVPEGVVVEASSRARP